MNKKTIELVQKLKEVDENSIDTTNANNMIQYLMVKIYKKDVENIDYETIEYLEYVKQKLSKSPNPDSIPSLKKILIANEKSAILNKFHAMQMQSKDFLKKYNDILERIDDITKLFLEKEKLDKKNQEEER